MTTTFPLVGIVVLNFNGRDCLPRCLQSLQSLRYPHFFVVVVDNASKDDSFVTAQKQFPQWTYILSHENKGFATGMNVGMRAAFERGADFVWLFNNDAWAEADSLGLLMAVASQNEQVGLLSPYVFDAETKRLWFGKGRIDFLCMRALHEVPSPQEQAAQWHRSKFLTGCALLVKKVVFERVGGLDERFFLYYEDADLSLRTWKQGFQVLVVPQALVWHGEQSKANPQKLYYLVLSGLLFFEKHATFWQKPYFLVYTTLRRLKNVFDGARGKAEAPVVRRAYADFYHDH